MTTATVVPRTVLCGTCNEPMQLAITDLSCKCLTPGCAEANKPYILPTSTVALTPKS